MKISTLLTRGVAVGLLLAVTACAANKPQMTTDLNAGLEVAAALESAYVSRPSADPHVVAEVARLMGAAQAAVGSWEASTSPADETAASAAISALVAYEAGAHVTP